MGFAMSGKPADRSARTKDADMALPTALPLLTCPVANWAAKLTGETCAISI